MEELVNELLRMEVDDLHRLFNGFGSSEAYADYMANLFRMSDSSNLDNLAYANRLLVKLQDLEMLLDIHLPTSEALDSLNRDYQISPHLKRDVEWYTMLFNIRGIKEYYYRKVIEMLNVTPMSDKFEQLEKTPQLNVTDEWITYTELIQKYNFKGVTMVKDRQWRKKHNFFPAKQEGKGCALRISVTELQRWLNGDRK